jgi:hypothetical protein
MRCKMAWEVHYRDRRFISSEHCTPYSIEYRRDVQVIAQTDSEHVWVTVPPCDFYMWDSRGGEPQWFGGDYAGLILYLLTPGSKAVLLGEHIDKYRYREILNKVTQTLGEKSGYNAGERKP